MSSNLNWNLLTLRNFSGMRFSPEISFESIQQQSAYQFAAFQNMLEYLSIRSPYYKKKFKEHKIDIANIKSLSDINFLPTTSKFDLQEHNWEFLCVPDKKVIEYTATIGAKGKPVNIALTENDLKRLTYNELQSINCAGGKKGDIFQVMLPLNRQMMAGMSYCMGIRKLGATLIRTGPGIFSMQMETILRLQPNSLIAVPSFIAKFMDWAEENNFDISTSSVQKVICLGESIRGGDFELNNLGKSICRHGNIKLYSSYSSTEMQTSFMECEAGQGCHHQPDLILLEILNEHGDSLPAGEYGEVVITTLGVEGMPLLRYRTGDICAYYDTPCACGRTTRRLTPIMGRRQQMIKFKGTTLYPDAIFNVLNSTNFITDYIVEVFTNEFDLDDIILHIVSSLSDESSEQSLRPLLKTIFSVMPHIQFHTNESIEYFQTKIGEVDYNKLLDKRENVL